MTAVSSQTTQTAHGEPAESLRGVVPSQGLWKAVEEGWISSGDFRILPQSIQPASLDLRLADHAWALRCSFLPSPGTQVMERVEDLALDRVDLREGATLERDRPYLIPLLEELDLPARVRAKANPKSSTGRLDVFTRVITDGNHRFDEIPAGYRGRLYLEVVPRSFAVRVEQRMSLNQLRLRLGMRGWAIVSFWRCTRSSRSSISTSTLCRHRTFRSPTVCS